MRAKHPPAVVIAPVGNAGNQILQYMFARTLATLVPDLQIFGCNLPDWGIVTPPLPLREILAPSIRQTDPDPSAIASLFRRHLLKYALIRRIPLDLRSLGDRRMHALYLTHPELAAYEVGPDEILINVRGAEILGPKHPDYGPVPVGFYASVIRETGLKPVFLGQLGDDFYSQMLRQAFPTARLVPSQGIVQDFESIRRARHSVISVSTFSWIAAWISEADSVHVPVLGFLNPRQREDMWLLPLEESRYHFYEFPLRPWTASDEQIRQLGSREAPRELSTAEIADLQRQRERSRLWARRNSAFQLAAHAAAVTAFSSYAIKTGS